MASNMIKLPDNAYKELKKGEVYKPIIPGNQSPFEITRRSLIWGMVMAFIFSAAAAYLGLKVATVFEAAIPIAIIAVGISGRYKRRSTILENVMIQSIGAASGVVVAGAIFTLPAIFILELDKKIGIDVLKLFLVAAFGGFLGILLLIPFRKYFVSDMHGKFPFPEATATTEVLVTGEKGGKSAITLLLAAVFAAVVDFFTLSVKPWAEVFSSRMLSAGETLYAKTKMVLSVDILSSITGLGYIIGLRYTAVIVAGSFVSWFVLIPLFSFFGNFVTEVIAPGDKLINAMSATEIFSKYVRHIGIGAIAAAGIMGIFKSSNVIIATFTKGFKEMFSKIETSSSDSKDVRTDRDIKMKTIIIGIALVALMIFFFFRFLILDPIAGPWKLSLIALLVVIIISFLFTSVAARAIAIVGTNPVSGMTLMTLILTAIIMSSVGLTGDYGMLAALLIGGVVCTSLSVAGGFITDLKIGYWIGSTPWNQERFKFVGIIISAIATTIVIMLLNDTYGFRGEGALPAPQANAMATILQVLMSPEGMPFIFFGIGIAFALLLELAAIPSLAFALGMYIPLELNVPLMLGGLISYLVVKLSKDEKLGQARREKGTLIASGFIAGGAIIGVVAALVKWVGLEDLIQLDWYKKSLGEPLALVVFLLILTYLFYFSWKAKKEE